MSWSLPDCGFTNLLAAENLNQRLGGAQWLSLPTANTGWLDNGNGRRIVVINQSILNTAFSQNPNNCYFGLFYP